MNVYDLAQCGRKSRPQLGGSEIMLNIEDEANPYEYPWLPLEVVIVLLERANVAKPSQFEDGLQGFVNGDELEIISRFLGRAAFRGRLRIRGWPSTPHGDVPIGPEQDIPVSYFVRQRSFYGAEGIGRLGFHASPEDLYRDDRLRETVTPGPDSDWLDVLVSGPDLQRALAEFNTRLQQSTELIRLAEPPKPKPGPKLDHLVDAARAMHNWLREANARDKPKVPPSARGKAIECFNARGHEIRLSIETMRKIFSGTYPPALKAAESGQIVPFWKDE